MINLTEWLCILFMVCVCYSETGNTNPLEGDESSQNGAPNVHLPLNNTVLQDQACEYFATTGMKIQVGRQGVAHKLQTNDLATLFEDFIHRVFRSIEIGQIQPLEAKYALQVGEYLFQNVPLKLHKRATGTELFSRCKEDSSILPTFTQDDLPKPEKKGETEIEI